VRRVHHADPRGVVTLSEEESHHVGRVLRLQIGDALSVFDGRGGEWEGRLAGWEGRSARVEIGEERTDPVEAPFPVRLFQGLCRPERMELLIQKGTEIGLSSIHPIATARSEGGPPSPGKMERWRRVALEACKQSGRRVIPEIAEVADFEAQSPPAGVTAFVLHPAPEAMPIGRYLEGAAPREVWLAVGPEGGFEESEVESLKEAGWLLATMGPRILRTETAGLVAAALILHRWGDVGS
jgi:16S rRNA (uracil1498-N3)-methyltransferase